MILIQSDKEEHSTDEVLQWLMFENFKFVRFNKNEFVDFNIGVNKNLRFSFGDIDFELISAYWFRRSKFIITYTTFLSKDICHLSNMSNSIYGE